MQIRSIAATAALSILVPVGSVLADSATLGAVHDNTLYESATGALSNGQGAGFFAGESGGGLRRRGLVAFDLASIPAGSTVTGAVLTLHLSQTQTGLVTRVELHRVLAAWGEGASNASSGGGGGGAAAAPGDATWIHTFYATSFWASAGGDFAPGASAALDVGDIGTWTWGSTPELVADVQGWLATPSTNFGWLLLGDESAASTAKRFDTRENVEVAFRPTLRVDYIAPVGIDKTTWSRVRALYH